MIITSLVMVAYPVKYFNNACLSCLDNGSSCWNVIYWGKPEQAHTSGKNCTSITLAKICVEIQINGMSVMLSPKFTFKVGDGL